MGFKKMFIDLFMPKTALKHRKQRWQEDQETWDKYENSLNELNKTNEVVQKQIKQNHFAVMIRKATHDD